MRISDWSSDVCSSDLGGSGGGGVSGRRRRKPAPAGHPLSRVFAFARPANAPSPRTRSGVQRASNAGVLGSVEGDHRSRSPSPTPTSPAFAEASLRILFRWERKFRRSETHTSELQSLMRISYAVFCLKKKKK